MSKKLIPTKEELEIIQNMIYKQESYSSIARKLKLAVGTIKRLITEHNIDMSKYDPIRKGTYYQKFIPTEEQKQLICDLLNNGHGKIMVAK